MTRLLGQLMKAMGLVLQGGKTRDGFVRTGSSCGGRLRSYGNVEVQLKRFKPKIMCFAIVSMRGEVG